MRRRPTTASVPLIVAAFLIGLTGVSRTEGQRVPEPPASIESEVLGNIRSQKIGVGQSVGDLAIGAPLLGRIVDRVVQSSYRDRSFFIQGEIPPPEPGLTLAPKNPEREYRETLRVVPSPELSPVLEAYRSRIPLGRPPVRGFRVHGVSGWPAEDPFILPVGVLRDAATVVGKGLATRGFMPTLVDAIGILGPADFRRARTRHLEQLRAVGFPTDLLPYFDRHGNGLALVRAIGSELAAGTKLTEVQAKYAGTEFRFIATETRFRAAVESGDGPVEALRFQLGRGDSWGGLDDGGSVEILRQILERVPDVQCVAHIEPRFVEVLRESLADLQSEWGRLRVLASKWPVTQWARDNGLAGSTVREGRTLAATLLPRYASRRQDGSEFVEGDSYLFDTLEATGHITIASPLLFQGGDFLVVRHPARQERWAFVGESEIARNRALGLTHDQVVEAFRIELGVDRCVVLPSISFHIDYDVTFRVIGEELVGFVEDPDTAVELVLGRALEVLREAGLIDADEATKLAEQLVEARTRPELREPFSRAVAERIYSVVDGRAAFPIGFVRRFSDRDIHRAVGNLQRVLSALDQYVARALEPSGIGGSGHQSSHLRAHRRQAALRTELARTLTELGVRVVPVPSFSAGRRSLNAINGLQLPGAYLLPEYGGKIGSAVDAAARAVFERELGKDVAVIGVVTAESQRRNGAIHCSVAAYPAPILAPVKSD